VHLRRQDLAIFWQIMVMREYDLQSLPQIGRVRATYQAILSEGKKPVIVDCGGHVGLSAVWFATHYPDALVYVVEPDASNFKILQHNTAAYANVIPLHGGVWGHSCRLTISNPQAGSASFRLQEAPDSLSLQQSNLLHGYTIEGISEPGELRRLFLVKIDIEGGEAELFQGPTEWLHSPALVIIELHDWLLPWQGTSRNLFRKLAENNFDAVLRGENLLLFQA
jgi:FkbM family methyltransferase